MNTLVNFRNLKKMTQKEMATKLGVTLSMYSKLELGLRNPSYKFLVRFKKTFKDVDVDSIFFNN
ncbi:MAG TPA: XRE family transcriptional regulator [Terrisporobacter glycolicus]|uniref:helix-turn-helix domain-containing protein n=1 Tax=Terrisporobacter TaxID=1505652 RepID=UPI000E8EB5DB|nr:MULTISPECIES: helix-turn-helix transcriptional regulator [Terrisporobacter]HBI91261.1 XRE family transcriptional regulator [Terrisporobacter hibernicus]